MAFFIAPVVYSVWLSFHELRGFQITPQFVGFANYIEAVQSAEFIPSLYRSFIWTGGTLLFQVLLGVVSALALNESFKGRSVARVIVLFPYVVASVVTAATWRWMYDDLFGVINYVLQTFRITETPVRWLDSSHAMLSLILVGVWQHYPFVTLYVLARLQSIREDLYEAVKVDGANVFQRFRSITLPEIREVLLIVILLRTIFMFGKFDVIWIVTGGGPGTVTQTWPILIYLEGFEKLNFALGSTMSVLVVLLLLALAIPYIRSLKL